MKRFLRITLLLLTVSFGIIAAAHEFGGNHIGFMTGFDYLPLFLFITFCIISFVMEWGNYKKTKRLHEFGVTIVGLLLGAMVFSQHLKRAIIERTATEMKFVSTTNLIPKTSIEFKKGSDFKLIEFEANEMIVYYGKYNRVNDTIKIISSNYDGPKKAIPMLGVIKNDTLFWIKADTMVLEK